MTTADPIAALDAEAAEIRTADEIADWWRRYEQACWERRKQLEEEQLCSTDAKNAES